MTRSQQTHVFAAAPPPWAREKFTDEQRARLPFMHLWRYALGFSNASILQRCVGHTLANHSPGGPDDWFGVGVDTLAEEAGAKRSATIRALAELDRRAFVARAQTKGGRHNVTRYLLTVPTDIKPSSKETVRTWKPSSKETVRTWKPSISRQETVHLTRRNRPADGQEEALQEALQDGAPARRALGGAALARQNPRTDATTWNQDLYWHHDPHDRARHVGEQLAQKIRERGRGLDDDNEEFHQAMVAEFPDWLDVPDDTADELLNIALQLVHDAEQQLPLERLRRSELHPFGFGRQAAELCNNGATIYPDQFETVLAEKFPDPGDQKSAWNGFNAHRKQGVAS